MTIDIKALREVLAKAAETPWFVAEEWEDEFADDKRWRRINSESDTSHEAAIAELGDWNQDGAANADLICAAVNNLAALLDECERLRAEAEVAKAVSRLDDSLLRASDTMAEQIGAERNTLRADLARVTKERDEWKSRWQLAIGDALSAVTEIEELTAERDQLRAEVERLTACLAKANANHEDFERRWYLACDEVERMRKLLLTDDERDALCILIEHVDDCRASVADDIASCRLVGSLLERIDAATKEAK